MPLQVSHREFARLAKSVQGIAGSEPAASPQPDPTGRGGARPAGTRQRAAPGTAPGSWPQGKTCTLCGQPIKRLQSFGCDAQERFAHPACLPDAGRPLSELQAAIEQWQEERKHYVKP